MKKRTIFLGIFFLLLAGAIAVGTYVLTRPEVTTAKEVTLTDNQRYSLTADKLRKDLRGKPQDMLAYNGSVPGPTLRVRQGSSVTVDFTNKLNQDTAVHFHGIRTDNNFDGVVGVTQAAVKPGGSYSYKLTFPDPGAYWYHPHMREDSTQPLGLYGTVIVEPKDPSYWSPVNKEVPLMVGDILMKDGTVVPFNDKRVTYTLMGRYGNTMLVNGSTDYTVDAVAGEVVRFYVTDVANVRPFRLAIPGAGMKLVGGDGGAYEKETFVDSVTIAPSERAIVDVLFDKPGTFRLQNQTPARTYDMAKVNVAAGAPKASYAAQFTVPRTNTAVTAEVNAVRALFTKPADKALTLSMNMPGMSGSAARSDNSTIEWEDTMPDMNKISDTNSLSWKLVDQQTKAENGKINWQFKRGDKVKLKLFNDPASAHPMQHPIHIHGQRFLVTSVNGKPVTNQVWKDTVLVGKGDTVELLVDMSNPGTWLIHCHIPEHMESGMSMQYKVI